MKQQYEKKDRHQEVTDLVIDFIETNQCLPYQREWDVSKCPTGIRPHNPVTGTVYSGINSVILSCSPAAVATNDYQFCTFAQAISQGWNIRKGAKSLPIVYFEALRRKDVGGDEHSGDLDRPANRFYGMLKGYRVFHRVDVQGMPAAEQPDRDPVTWTVPRGVAAIIRNSGVTIHEGSDKAFYSPVDDTITLPPKSAFTGDTDEIKAAHHAAVTLHELSHAAENERRLNLAVKSRFGAPEYARGELRVELASAFICSEYGLPTKLEQHASYVQSWLKALRNDKNEIFRASRDAQKIFDYLMPLDPEYKLARKPDHEDAPTALDAILPASSLPTSAQPSP